MDWEYSKPLGQLLTILAILNRRYGLTQILHTYIYIHAYVYFCIEVKRITLASHMKAQYII